MTRRLAVGEVLTSVFDVYRKQAALLLPAALIVFLIPTIGAAVLLPLLTPTSGPVLLALLIPILLSIIASFWYQGIVVEAVGDIRDGVRDHNLGTLAESVQPVLWPLVGAGLLAGLGIVAGFIALVVPGFVLLTWWALISPLIVVERTPVMESFGRSRSLVRGDGWAVFGVILVLGILQLVVSSVLQRIGGGSVGGILLTSLIASVLTAPLGGIAAAVMYFELRRIRGEAAGPGLGEGLLPPAPGATTMPESPFPQPPPQHPEERPETPS